MINRRDLEIEIKHNWQAIFDKYNESSTQKYRKELTPNITFQPNKIFVRNNLFEKIIKICKVTNLEFLKLEKLGLCLYEDICDEQEFISMSEEIFKEEKVSAQHYLKNEKLRKEENEKVRKEENEKVRKEENEKVRKQKNEKLRKEENEKVRKEENEKVRKEGHEKLRKKENEKLRKE